MLQIDSWIAGFIVMRPVQHGCLLSISVSRGGFDGDGSVQSIARDRAAGIPGPSISVAAGLRPIRQPPS
jgi:hypothetical protein